MVERRGSIRRVLLSGRGQFSETHISATADGIAILPNEEGVDGGVLIPD